MKYLLPIVAVVLILWGIIHFAVNGWHTVTGSGIHTGYVTAVEKNGLIYPTWSAYIKSDTQSSQEDLYCVSTDYLAQQLQGYSEQKAHVTVEYIQYVAKGLKYCNGEDAGVIMGVTVDN